MRYYPLNLDINQKLCVVIGGGRVAERKVEQLLAASGNVKVIAPQATDKLKKLDADGDIKLISREYGKGDLTGAALAFIATDEPSVNKDIVAEAHESGILINVGDMPEYCDFIVPAIVERGDVTLAISTGGASPALAAHLRRQIESVIGEEYGPFARMLRAIRALVLQRVQNSSDRKKLFEQLIESNLREHVSNRNKEEIDSTLMDILGEGYGLAELGIEL